MKGDKPFRKDPKREGPSDSYNTDRIKLRLDHLITRRRMQGSRARCLPIPGIKSEVAPVIRFEDPGTTIRSSGDTLYHVPDPSGLSEITSHSRGGQADLSNSESEDVSYVSPSDSPTTTDPLGDSLMPYRGSEPPGPLGSMISPSVGRKSTLAYKVQPLGKSQQGGGNIETTERIRCRKSKSRSVR